MRIKLVLFVALSVLIAGCGEQIDSGDYRYMFESAARSGGTANEIQGLWYGGVGTNSEARIEIGENYFIGAVRCRLSGEEVIVGKRVSAKITDSEIILEEEVEAEITQNQVRCYLKGIPSGKYVYAISGRTLVMRGPNNRDRRVQKIADLADLNK